MNVFLLLVIFSYLVVNHKAVSEITQDFNQCKEFFYKGTPPQMNLEKPAVRICQKYEQNYHFATRYSTYWKIPIYSAYELPRAETLRRDCLKRQTNRPSKWLIEPQVGKTNPDDFSENMLAEKQRLHDEQSQAVNKDYEDTGFDRGHLNPAAYHCDAARNATFTLTNCVPQDPCFNRLIWYELETESKKIMKTMCHTILGARSYFVTGAVPINRMIPNAEHDRKNSLVRVHNRVSVPGYMWTAVCCDTSEAVDPTLAKGGFSFGYYGENTISAHSMALKVSDLNSAVAQFFKGMQVQIFADECFEDSPESEMALDKISQPISLAEARALDGVRFMKEETLPRRKRKMVSEFSNTMPNVPKALKKAVENNLEWDVRISGVGVYIPPKKVVEFRKTVSDLNMDLVRKSVGIGHIVASWLQKSELDENFISNPANDAAIEEDVSTSDEEVDYYQLTPKIYNNKVTADGESCYSTYSCGDHGNNYHWCWTGATVSEWDYCCEPDSKCEFSNDDNKPRCNAGKPGGNKQLVSCSMRSSTVARNGNSCTSNECGLHGYSYYWCTTESGPSKCCDPWNPHC